MKLCMHQYVDPQHIDIHTFSFFSSREVEFIQKEDAERRRLEEAEKVHLAEIQGLQVRVISHFFTLLYFSSLMTVHIFASQML